MACLLFPFPLAAAPVEIAAPGKPASTEIGAPAILTSVSQWKNARYTAVVLETDRRVSWRARTLAAEPGLQGRIYVDLAQSQLKGGTGTLVIGDRFVDRVRVGQYQPDVVRAVLEVESVERYRVESLSDPERVVIYVWGEDEPGPGVNEPLTGQRLVRPVEPRQPAAAPGGAIGPEVSPAATMEAPATVTGMLQLPDPALTIVVLELDRRVTWAARRLAPEPGKKGRIYIDIENSRLDRRARPLTIRDPRVEQVRVGQYRPDAVRVVLDVETIEDFRIEPQSNPERLVVTVWGGKPSKGRPNEGAGSRKGAPTVDVGAVAGAPSVAAGSPGRTAAPAGPTPVPTEGKASGAPEVRGEAKGVRKSQGLPTGNKAETLFLDVAINTERLPEIVRVERLADGRLALPLEVWEAARLRPDDGGPLSLPDDQRGYALESIPDLTYDLDRGRMALTITAPPSAFSTSAIDFGRGVVSPPNLSRPGFYFNYDLNVAGDNHHLGSSGALIEGVAFNSLGSIGSGTVLRREEQRTEAIRMETFYRRDLPGPMETLVVGDTVGSGGTWSRPARYAGIRWARDFTLRPGFIVTPMTSFSGSAALPSTIDVLINNQRRQSERVESGPFELTNVPVVSGAGEINLIVRDPLGRETVISRGYYLSPRLLAPGLSDFSLEAGVFRENYGSKSNDYSDAFVAGTVRKGLTSSVTGEGRLELQEDRQAAGVALTSLVGTVGAVEAAAAMSVTNGAFGGHYVLGFERSAPGGGGSIRWEYYDRDFNQFASLPAESLPRQQFSAGLGMPLFGKASVGMGLSYKSTWEGDDFTMLSINLGVSLPWNIYLSAYGGRRFDSVGEMSGGLSVTMALGRQRTASARTSVSSEGTAVTTGEVSQSVPAGPGLGWLVRASDDPSRHWQAGLSLNTNVGNLNAEIGDSTEGVSFRLGARGSFGLLAGLPFATRSIGQGSFAVVTVGDLKGVPVYRSNQFVSTTNSRGLALVPELLPYQKNEITIDPVELPFDVDIRGVKETALPYARSGVVVAFPVRRSRNATVLLRQGDGTAVPAGARVTVSPAEREFMVGRRGEAYLTDLADRNRLTVRWQGGGCELDVPLDPKGPPEPRIGPLTCGDKP